MRAALSAIVALVGPACSAREAPPLAVEAEIPAASLPPRDAIERDLVLTLHARSSEPFELHRDRPLDVAVENRSRGASYPFATTRRKDVGWAEPEAWFTVESRASSSEPWRALAPIPVTRCGLYDRIGERSDVAPLGPGASAAIPSFASLDRWDLEEARELRVTAHFAYGEALRTFPGLRQLPPAVLSSPPIELAVAHPLALALELTHGTLPGYGEPVADSLRVVLENRSPRPQPFLSASDGASLRLQVDAGPDQEDGDVLNVDGARTNGVPAENIAPGERRDALGGAPLIAITRARRGFRPARARAVLTIPASDGPRTVVSPWVPIR